VVAGTGALAASLPMPTAATTATVVDTAALSATALLPTAELTGTVADTGTLAATSELPTAAFTGDAQEPASSSVRFDSAGDRLYLAATLPNPAATGLTVLGWWRIRVDQDTFTDYYRTSAGGTIHTVASGVSGASVNVFTTGGEITATYINAVDEWIGIAVVDTGAGVTQYVRTGTGSIVSKSGNVGSGTPTQICIGGRSNTDATEWLNGNAAFVRVFADALTQTEVEAGWNSASPVLTAWADWPLQGADDLEDHSGNGRHLTPVSTTPTTEDGPPVASGTELTASLPMPTAVLSGTVTVTGTAAGTIPLPTGALTGTVVASGQLSATSPAPSGVLSAALAAGGTLSGGLPTPTASIAGTVTGGGELAATLPVPISMLGAVGGALGDLVATVVLPAAQILADVRDEGTLAGSLPVCTAELVAEVANPAALLAALEPPAAALVAGSTADGVLVAVLPLPLVALYTPAEVTGVLQAGDPVRVSGLLVGSLSRGDGLAAGEPTRAVFVHG
jgi:hypothetical protein